MAHDLEVTANGTRYIETTGVNSWHGGRHIAGLTIEQACEALGIEMEEYVKVPEQFIWEGRTRPVGTYTVLRPSDGKVMGSGLSANYQIHQPRQMLECYRAVAEAGDMELRTAFFLDGGKKFVACAKLKDGKARHIDGTPETYKVEPFGVIAGSNDGTMATRMIQQAEQVVCANTLAIAQRNVEDGRASLNLSIRHTSELTPEVVAQVQRYVADMLSNYEAKMDWLGELRATELPAEAGLVFAAYLGAAELPNESKATYDQWVLAQAKLSGRTPGGQLLHEMIERGNAAQQVVVDLLASSATVKLDQNVIARRKNGKTTQLLTALSTAPGQREYGNSALALQTATTYAVDHLMGRHRETALDSAWFGAGARLKTQADGLLAEMLASYSETAKAGSAHVPAIISDPESRSVEQFFPRA